MKHIEKLFVINLAQDVERFNNFAVRYPLSMYCERWPARYGGLETIPEWWKATVGAYGAYLSHLSLLEHCRDKGIESVAIFEDDCVFRPDAEEQLDRFMDSIPQDWDMVYFGGQLLHEIDHPPEKISDGVYRPSNVNRLHAYAVHSRGYDAILSHLMTVPFPPAIHNQPSHIDHHLGHLHQTRAINVCVPGEWICGQAAGESSIDNHRHVELWWTDPKIASEPFKFCDNPPENGVGSELAKILTAANIKIPDNAYGHDLLKQMNAWGVECIHSYRNFILDRLRTTIAESEVSQMIERYSVHKRYRFAIIDWADPARSFLELAVNIDTLKSLGCDLLKSP